MGVHFILSFQGKDADLKNEHIAGINTSRQNSGAFISQALQPVQIAFHAMDSNVQGDWGQQ